MLRGLQETTACRLLELLLYGAAQRGTFLEQPMSGRSVGRVKTIYGMPQTCRPGEILPRELEPRPAGRAQQLFRVGIQCGFEALFPAGDVGGGSKVVPDRVDRRSKLRE